MSKYNVKFEPDGKTVSVEEGATITKAAALAGININSPCGGEGRCGKCKVLVKGQNLKPPQKLEKDSLSDDELLKNASLLPRRNGHDQKKSKQTRRHGKKTNKGI